jgi:hypothetical protein
MIPDPLLDTASQRPPTGMDYGARALILGTLQMTHSAILQAFLAERFLSVDDYLSAVEPVWGSEQVETIRTEIERAANQVPSVTSFGEQAQAENLFALTVLAHLPESDFRSAVLLASLGAPVAPTDAINRICRNRRIEWEFETSEGFAWIGDEEVEQRAIRPALSAITDARFAGATRSEFDQARVEIALGTPASLKQAVHESGCAVESAMKVLLAEHSVSFDENDAAFKLFDLLTQAGVVPRFMERVVLGAASPRNKRGGHGAGALPHDVPHEMAEAVLASAAVAIAYLHKCLP